ncbi:hypothetical protein PR048_014180 [Dryococelus australis]|uniref:Uncharacterized protein n=1 Tax=Dryococelus australis TaxID=614101 RepID=A0ABQ9HDG6_9NEOP|nr:hypothetical protein PR048_014180 [Dryococelus australis]
MAAELRLVTLTVGVVYKRRLQGRERKCDARQEFIVRCSFRVGLISSSRGGWAIALEFSLAGLMVFLASGSSRVGYLGFSRVGNVTDVGVGRWVFSGHSRFLRPCIPPLIRLHKGRDGVAVGLPASLLGELGSILRRVAPGFSHGGNRACRRVFSGISHLPRPLIPALIHTHLVSPSSTLNPLHVKRCPNLSTPLHLRLISPPPAVKAWLIDLRTCRCETRRTKLTSAILSFLPRTLDCRYSPPKLLCLYYVIASHPRCSFDCYNCRSRIFARENRTGRCRCLRGFSRTSHFPRLCFPALLRNHIVSPSSALKSSLLRATTTSSLCCECTNHRVIAFNHSAHPRRFEVCKYISIRSGYDNSLYCCFCITTQYHAVLSNTEVKQPLVPPTPTGQWTAVAERLACSPPTKANWGQSPAGSWEFRKWESCRTRPLVGGFSRGSPVSPALSFRRHSILTSITRIGSQNLAVTSRPNLLTLHFRPHTPAKWRHWPAKFANQRLEIYSPAGILANRNFSHHTVANETKGLGRATSKEQPRRFVSVRLPTLGFAGWLREALKLALAMIGYSVLWMISYWVGCRLASELPGADWRTALHTRCCSATPFCWRVRLEFALLAAPLASGEQRVAFMLTSAFANDKLAENSTNQFTLNEDARNSGWFLVVYGADHEYPSYATCRPRSRTRRLNGLTRSVPY